MTIFRSASINFLFLTFLSTHPLQSVVEIITTSSFCRRRIKVVDVNDNRPEFTLRAQGTGGYSFSTKETVRVGETLYTSVAVKVKSLIIHFSEF